MNAEWWQGFYPLSASTAPSHSTVTYVLASAHPDKYPSPRKKDGGGLSSLMTAAG